MIFKGLNTRSSSDFAKNAYQPTVSCFLLKKVNTVMNNEHKIALKTAITGNQITGDDRMILLDLLMENKDVPEGYDGNYPILAYNVKMSEAMHLTAAVRHVFHLAMDGFAFANNKLGAIKFFRSLTGWTLVDSKNWVEQNYAFAVNRI